MHALTTATRRRRHAEQVAAQLDRIEAVAAMVRTSQTMRRHGLR